MRRAELHNASVCLFHRRFGGAPHADEFARYRVGSGRRGGAAATPRNGSIRAFDRLVAHDANATLQVHAYDEAPLDGFVDEFDETVYAAALGRFRADLDDSLRALRLVDSNYGSNSGVRRNTAKTPPCEVGLRARPS